MSEPAIGRSAAWKWTVCGLLFLATLLNYMDRQTLAQTSPQIKSELKFNEDHYGRLEWAFGLSFAAGGLLFGLLADRINVWLLYPVVLTGWSVAGFLTGSAAAVGKWITPLYPPWALQYLDLTGIPDDTLSTYLGLFSCRILLGLFEAGQWPCALVTTSRLLTAQDRPFGNSLLQSGASIGAVFTPVAKIMLVSESQPGSWSTLFHVIGAVGLLWIIPWFAIIRPKDLERPKVDPAPKTDVRPRGLSANFVRMYLAVALTVILINIPWHFYRAWLPLFLREFHNYGEREVDWFIFVYWLCTDVGCLIAGWGIRKMAQQGTPVHTARLTAFGAAAVLTAFGALAGLLHGGPMLLVTLLITAMGSLALFPIYYSLTQELSARHQGKVTGTLSCLTWVCTAMMQQFVGKTVQETQSYTVAFLIAGVMPIIALGAIAVLWPRNQSANAAPIAMH